MKQSFKTMTEKFIKIFSAQGVKYFVGLFQSRVKEHGENYYYLGIFGLTYYLISSLAFTFGNNTVQDLLISLRLIALAICFALCIHEMYLPKKICEQYMPMFWYFALFYCLPFLSLFTVLVSGLNPPWLVNMMLSEFLLYVLAGWRACIILTCSGLVFAWILFSYCGYVVSSQINNYAHILVLIYGVCTLSILYFLKQKDIFYEKELESRVIYGKSMAHEVKQPLSAIYMSAEIFDQILSDKEHSNQITREELKLLKELTSSFKRTALKGINTVNMLLSVLREDLDKAADTNIYNIHECVLKALEDYVLTKRESSKIEIDDSNTFLFMGSAYFIKHVIINLISNSFKYAGYNATIKISYKNNSLHLYDNGVGIAQDEIHNIFKKFHNSKGKLEGSGIGLAFCKEVMDKMGGWIECKSRSGEYTEFILTFPIVENLRLNH